MSEKEVETVVTEQEVPAEVAQADEQAGFDASFTNEARDDKSPAVVEEQAQPEVQAEQEGQPAVEAEPKKEEPAVSAEQLAAMLEKMPKIEELETMTAQELRKVHGKFGEINRALQELQKSVQDRKTGNISEAKFTRLAEEYPELAQLLSEDLKEIGLSAGGAQAVDPQAVEEKVAAVREDMAKQMQHNLLLIQHKDYPDVVASSDFKAWMGTLPPEEQEELNASWDAVYLGEKISAFKEWHNKKQNGSADRRERLHRAVTPQGKAAPPVPGLMTEEDGFALAFKK